MTTEKPVPNPTQRSDQHATQVAVLIISCLLVYAQVYTHNFIPFHDDNTYIVFNTSIAGLSLTHIKTAFSTIYAGNYAPLQIISYMLNHALSGLKPAGFLLTNVALHIANGLLLQRLLIRNNFPSLGATAAAAIFLLHPVQVEAVAWASERKTVLAMFFFLLALHSYQSYLAQEQQWDKARWYGTSLLCFVLALLSKSVVVILPATLIVYDLAYRQGNRRLSWLPDKLPFILLALAGVALTIYTQDPLRSGGRADFHGGSPLATLLTMLPVLSKYLHLVFWPTDLSIYYGGIQVKTAFDETVFRGGMLALALAAGGLVLWRAQKVLFCWYAFFFIGLLPVSQIIPIVTLINDRYLYFPLLGAAPFIVGSMLLLVGKLPRLKTLCPLVAIAIGLTLAILTFRQVGTWQNTLTLYRQVVRTNPEQIDLKFLEDSYFLASDLNGLLEITPILLKNFPNAPAVQKFAGVVYSRTDEPLRARPFLERAAIAAPQDRGLLSLLAENYRKTGEDDQARRIYERIMVIDSNEAPATKARAPR